MSKEQEFVDLLNREMERLQGYLKGKKEPQTAIECEELVRPFVYKIEELTAHNYIKDQRIAELEEQLKGCVRPKFKVGQTVYTFNKNTECVYELCIKIIRIEMNQISKFNSLVYLAERLEDGNFFGYFEVELFATKKEAQAKLQQMKGE